MARRTNDHLSTGQIPVSCLDSFLFQIEQGYMKYSNPYHNNLHAADVTQTVHYMLWVTGLAVSVAAAAVVRIN